MVGGRASRAMCQPAPKAQFFNVALARAGLWHGARSDAIHPLSERILSLSAREELAHRLHVGGEALHLGLRGRVAESAGEWGEGGGASGGLGRGVVEGSCRCRVCPSPCLEVSPSGRRGQRWRKQRKQGQSVNLAPRRNENQERDSQTDPVPAFPFPRTPFPR